MGYTFYFGDSDASYTPWTIQHLESFKTEIKKSVTAYGLPTKSSQASQIFDMQGPVRTFSFSFTRMDYEEDVSNWDFMYTKVSVANGKKYQGLDWFTARMQVTHPYILLITFTADSDTPADTGIIPVGKYYVSVTSITCEMSTPGSGMMTYSLELTERRR